MATAVIPPSVQVAEDFGFRNAMIAAFIGRLRHLAHLTLNVRGQKNTEWVAVCVQAYSRWRWVADILVPGLEWSLARKSGTHLIVHGLMDWKICDIVARAIPNLAPAVLKAPPEGFMKVIVLSERGCTIFDLSPKDPP